MGKKNDLPAMPFYVGDWLKAPDIRSLRPETRGIWFDMLCFMWESNERGYLVDNAGTPYTMEELSRMIGLPEDLLKQNVEQMRSKKIFSLRDSDGAIYCRRMARDEEIRKIRSESGKKGGISNFARNFAQAKRRAKLKQITESENEDENEDEKNIHTLYSLYPKKVGKGQAIKAIRSALKKAPFETLYKSVEEFSKSCVGKDPQYIPFPATWFNGERWADEKPTIQQSQQKYLSDAHVTKN